MNDIEHKMGVSPHKIVVTPPLGGSLLNLVSEQDEGNGF